MGNFRKTICVDFDGVLHGYSKGWQGGEIYDVPKPASADGMKMLLDAGFEVVIYSTRCYNRTINGVFQKNQVKEMTDWLNKFSIPYSRIHEGSEKPICVLFIDDNAYRFLGDWDKEIPIIFNYLKKYETVN
jgi:hypothetical protein